jgi:hypothetical protein
MVWIMMDRASQQKGEVRRVRKKRLLDALFPDVDRCVVLLE